MSKSRRKFGFTLVELMIVIAIISILVAILVPNFVRSRAQGQLSSCEENEKNIGTALAMYSTDNNGHYPVNAGAFKANITPNYLKVIPTCPSAGTDSYSGHYAAASNPDAFTFVCSGSNHTSLLNASTNFPQYNSAQGLVTGH
jgi:prepilin-type N-terminal cleavage/methylation domain-containing protein